MREASWQTIVANVHAFKDYSYSTRFVTYPWVLPGVNVPITPYGMAGTTNCVCFAEALLVRSFAPDWSYDLHRAFMITNGDPFGPVHAAIESGMGEPLEDEDYFAGGWRLMQGWRRDGGGHCFIVVRMDVVNENGDKAALVLESNLAHNIAGVGYRGLGWRDTLPDVAPSAWTEERLRRTYPKLIACALRVR